MKLAQILAWMDGVLEPRAFDDGSNNGLQIAREGDDVSVVAFAVDGSVAAVKAAAAAGAQLLVVHHGISWGGGIRRITDGAYNIIKAAMEANLALFAMHLPLDANQRCGNNWEIARFLQLKRIRPAFNYHGNVIGVIGTATRNATVTLGNQTIRQSKNQTIGICSGGAGDFAAEAKRLGCDLFITGEASWGDVIAAENEGASLVCCGHYETETFGVEALAREMQHDLSIKTINIRRN